MKQSMAGCMLSRRLLNRCQSQMGVQIRSQATVDLAGQSAKPINQQIQAIQLAYQQDYPSAFPNQAVKTLTDEGNSAVTPVVVQLAKERSAITSESEYVNAHSAWTAEVAAHEVKAVTEFLAAHIDIVVDDQADPSKLRGKLQKIPLMKERRHKLFVQEFSLMKPVNWPALKRQRTLPCLSCLQRLFFFVAYICRILTYGRASCAIQSKINLRSTRTDHKDTLGKKE